MKLGREERHAENLVTKGLSKDKNWVDGYELGEHLLLLAQGKQLTPTQIAILPEAELQLYVGNLSAKCEFPPETQEA